MTWRARSVLLLVCLALPGDLLLFLLHLHAVEPVVVWEGIPHGPIGGLGARSALRR